MPVIDYEAQYRRDVLLPAILKRLDAAGKAVEEHARELVSAPGRTAGFVMARSKKTGKTRFAWRKKARTGRSSAPGEPPLQQTGKLRRSIRRRVDRRKLVARVGSKLGYGWLLEVGTPRMPARPWLRRALAERRSEIRSIFS